MRNKNHILYFSEEDAKIFFDAIENPSQPNKYLQKAFKDYIKTLEQV